MQQKVRFDNRAGHSLSGVLHKPSTEPVLAYALFAHCFTCTKSINSATNIADTLARNGVATLRFDFTGLGASKGSFTESNFSTDVEDLVDAAGFLEQEYSAPQLLVGHSLGGTAILAAAKDIKSANAVASIGSPASPEHILHLLESKLDTIEKEGDAEVELAGRPFVFNQKFVDDARGHTINYRSLDKALMVMHAPLDDLVSVNEAGKIFSQALHPKSFVTLDDADHLLSRKHDAQYVGDVLASWAMRYIDTPEPDNTKVSDSGVRINAATNEGFLCDVTANGHHLIADEPKSMGGTNLGPSPYDLLGSALGTCTAMTLNMYARHKKIAVSNVSVDIAHSRIHADDCVDCEKQNGKIDVFTRSISIDGELSEQQLTRMLQIADRCPVHKTLENEIKIETELREPLKNS